MSSATSEPSWRWERGAGRRSRTLWFDQPGRSQNVLDLAGARRAGQPTAEVENDGGIRELVIRSAKPAGFCAGLDLKTILSCEQSQTSKSFVSPGPGGLRPSLRPVGARPQRSSTGPALGQGSSWPSRAGGAWRWPRPAPLQIGTPEVHLGLIPAWGAITRLPRLIGPDDGLDLLISGRSIGYLLARSHGIVDRLAAEADLEWLDVLLGPAPAERTWPKEGWEAAWNRARCPDRRTAGRSPRGPAPDPGDPLDRPRPRPRGRREGDRQSPGRAGHERAYARRDRHLAPIAAGSSQRLIATKPPTDRERSHRTSMPISSPSPIMYPRWPCWVRSRPSSSSSALTRRPRVGRSRRAARGSRRRCKGRPQPAAIAWASNRSALPESRPPAPPVKPGVASTPEDEYADQATDAVDAEDVERVVVAQLALEQDRRITERADHDSEAQARPLE